MLPSSVHTQTNDPKAPKLIKPLTSSSLIFTCLPSSKPSPHVCLHVVTDGFFASRTRPRDATRDTRPRPRRGPSCTRSRRRRNQRHPAGRSPPPLAPPCDRSRKRRIAGGMLRMPPRWMMVLFWVLAEKHRMDS